MVAEVRLDYQIFWNAIEVDVLQVLSGEIPFKELKGDGQLVLAITQGSRPSKAPSCSQTGRSYTPVWVIAEKCWSHEPRIRLSMEEVIGRLVYVEAEYNQATTVDAPVVEDNRTRDITRRNVESEEQYSIVRSAIQFRFYQTTEKERPYGSVAIPPEHYFLLSCRSSPARLRGTPRISDESVKLQVLRQIPTTFSLLFSKWSTWQTEDPAQQAAFLDALVNLGREMTRPLATSNVYIGLSVPERNASGRTSPARFHGVIQPGGATLVVESAFPFHTTGRFFDMYLARDSAGRKLALKRPMFTGDRYIVGGIRLREAADGFAYLHDQGITHGDVKGSNILVSGDVHSKICDFGLADIFDPNMPATVKGLGAGGVRWQAPETWRNMTPTRTKQTDVYSFGITIAEVLKGNTPFARYDINSAVILAVLRGRRPSKTPLTSPQGKSYGAVWDVAERCWAEEPLDRPTMQEAHKSLIEAEQSQIDKNPDGARLHSQLYPHFKTIASHTLVFTIVCVYIKWLLNLAVLPLELVPNTRGMNKQTVSNSPSNRLTNTSRMLLLPEQEDRSRSPTDALLMTLHDKLAALQTYSINPDSIEFQSDAELVFGGSGTVHIAVLNGHRVAVKKLRPSGGRYDRIHVGIELIRELTVWTDLEHPNILSLVGFHLAFASDGAPEDAWLLSLHMPNGNIREYLQLTQPDDALRMQLAIDTAEGLLYLHSRDPSVCHGDIKSANVLVGHGPRAVLCDFGLAKAMADSPSGLTTTRFMNRGSTRYQSPELVMNSSCVRTLESDIWAWGCLLLEILTDDLPYCDVSGDAQILLHIARNELPSSLDNPRLTEEMCYVLRSCWQIDRDQRPRMVTLRDTLVSRLALPYPESPSEEFEPGSPAMSESISDLHIELEDQQPLDTSGLHCSLFLGRDITGRRIALKSPRSRGKHVLKRLRREAKFWQGLQHEHLLPFFGMCKINRRVYIASPYILHGSLKNYVANFPGVNRIRLLREVSDGLRYLHNHDIVHGNIKATNVMISDDATALLCDFRLNDVLDPRRPRAGRLLPPHAAEGKSRDELLRDAAEGIRYLATTAAHGDIKASNVVISTTPDDMSDFSAEDSLSLDLGLSLQHRLKPAIEEDRYWISGTELRNVESVRWHAPELFNSQAKSPQSDVYAFSMLIVETLSGDIPFKEYESYSSVMFAVAIRDQRPLKVPHRSTSGTPYRPVWELADRCWAKNPRERPGMDSVHRTLSKLLQSKPGPEVRETPTRSSYSLPSLLSLPTLHFS
ncbi:hypothetical protein FRB99_003040 [Tulasnella sp. 403]|nr:hypothetical protein FRB99_003040 [Tulasnella sp. 403]